MNLDNGTQLTLPRAMAFGHDVTLNLDLLRRDARAIQDPAQVEFLEKLDLNLRTVLDDVHIDRRFLEAWKAWAKTKTIGRVHGLDDYAHMVSAHGTTEVFDKWYLRNNRCRFRAWRGEYMYHFNCWRNKFPGRWLFLDDAELAANDCVVFSWPFSDTGGTHLHTLHVLDQAFALKVPVLVDATYCSLSITNVDISHPAITEACFSLSKFAPVPNARVGIRLSREDEDDGLSVHSKHNYTNRISAAVGLAIVNNFDPDYVCRSYREKQLFMCNHLKLEASDTVIFGLGDENWSSFNRGGLHNRVGLYRILTG